MASELKLDEDTQGTDVAAAFASRIKGKTILVTGISPGGIGQSTAFAFASQSPALLILASRTKSNIEIVANAIKEKHPNVDIRILVVDFAALSSVRAAADELLKDVSKIDILVNNAAVSPHSRQWTAERIELQFGANHIGPFLFTNLLMPLLRNAAKDSAPGDTRIVNVSSGGHNISPIRFHDYNLEGKPIPDEEKPMVSRPGGLDFSKKFEDGYPRFIAYGQSKTANVLFSLYLQQNLKSAGIVSYALHPGTIPTQLGRDAGPPKEGEKPFPPPEWKTKTLDGGSSTSLLAALDPSLSDTNGLYLSDCALQEPAAHAKDPVAAEKLWKLSEELTGSSFPLN